MRYKLLSINSMRPIVNAMVMIMILIMIMISTMLLSNFGFLGNMAITYNVFKNVFTMHLQSSKWSREEYVSSFEAYMTIGTLATGGNFFPIVSYLGLGKIATQQVFEWAMKYPKFIQAFGKIARIEDNLEEDDPMEEEATEEPSAISCYMKQHKGINKDQAYEELQKILDEAWMDINHAMLGPTIMPKTVLQRSLNQARFIYGLYRNGDGFTCSSETPMKMNLVLLFKDQILM